MLALKIQIAEGLLPTLTDLFTNMTDGAALQKQLNAATEDGVLTQQEAALAWQEVRMGVTSASEAQADLTAKIEAQQAALDAVDPFVQNARAAAEALATAEANQAASVQASTDRWAALADMYEQRTTPAAYGYLEASDLLKEGLSGLTEQLIFNKAAAGLSADAALQLGIDMGLVDTRVLALNESLPLLKEKYDTNHDGAISAAEAANGYSAAVQALTDAILAVPKQTDINVDTYFNTHGTPPSNYGAPAGPPAQTGTNADARASGGPVQAGSAYWVGEQGPELVVPSSSGSVMSADLSKRLVAALERLATDGGQITHNYYGYGTSGDTGDSRALAGALS